MLQADVAIVGSGPAGISAALTLARAGAKVLLLERGPRDPAQAPRSFVEGESVGDSYFPLPTTRAAGFAGTSALWIPGMFRTAPLTPLDFESRPGVPNSGWPITRAMLNPYYEQAVPWCGMGRWDFTPGGWQSADRQPLPFTTDAVQTVVFQSASADTWLNRYAEVTSASNLRLLCHACVVDVRTGNDRCRVERLRVRTLNGAEFEIASRVVVLAAGGLENARLLLLSRDHHPNGLGNRHDLVGRFFQEHLALRGGIIRFSNQAMHDRMGLYFMHTHEGGTRAQGKLVVGEGTLRNRHLLDSAFFVTRVPGIRAGESARSIAMLRRALSWRPVPPDLPAHAGRVLRHFPTATRAVWDQVRRSAGPDTFQLLSESEQSPNPDSRVTLSPSRTDVFGLPGLRLDWRTSERDRHSIVESQRIIDRALRDSGLGQLDRKVEESSPPDSFAGHWHHMGTTRMSDDARQGVVDRNCRVHGVENLFIAGSSVFPTSGYANPVLTIVALALRLADHLGSELRRIA